MGALRGRTEAPQSSSRLLILQALLLQRMIETSTSLWSRSTHHAPMLRICRNYCCSNPETGAHRTRKFSRQRDFLRPTRILSGSHKTRVCTQIHVFLGHVRGREFAPLRRSCATLHTEPCPSDTVLHERAPRPCWGCQCATGHGPTGSSFFLSVRYGSSSCSDRILRAEKALLALGFVQANSCP